MSEIRSTLELVMKKTKGLTLSQKDREEQSNKEVKLTIDNLLQKFQNRTLRKEQLEEECKALEKAYGMLAHNTVINESLERINLGEDAHLILGFLKDFLKLKVEPVESLLKNYEEALRSFTQERITQLKKILERKNSISGSAVIPNVEVDGLWINGAKEIKDKFFQQLGEQKERIKSSALTPQ